MACCLMAPNHYLVQSDIISQHMSRSTLAQLMARCLTSPNHYVGYCWRIINKARLHFGCEEISRSDMNITHHKWKSHIWKFCYISQQQLSSYSHSLMYWGRVTHLRASNLTMIYSNNGLSSSRCQAIIWSNAWIWLIGALGANCGEILYKIHTFSFKKCRLRNGGNCAIFVGCFPGVIENILTVIF